ncbi:interferon-induced GTP-binding protein mx2 [Cercophora scortea]|uniref:Interferon-induced GTP-binding protein mx2 n=1 Tax=Cercophora scortea TaxID=314031 RepID=A0AAE0J0Z8_9PEZI|nr:interferon-induced GTP-binding protein mx2 [Cercophora scortea]
MAASTTEEGPLLLTSVDRLNKIDKLRERNIGKDLPLPQLVAVGDQSSGKSSLLESLTGIPFPHGQELCTRYATQITHRREDVSHINISIIPGHNASAKEKEHLESYRRYVKSSEELQAQFPIILNESWQRQYPDGYQNKPKPGRPEYFTEDVLKIEKCGPDEDYLTVIDVPGIFRLTAEGVTTNKDKKLVIDMVKRYIRDPRTIILAVLPANVDVFTQEILALAEKYDKDGERTLGVLTKPDLVTEISGKIAVCNVVKGKRKPLNLGYYIVRNRGGDDSGEKDVDVADLRDREGIFKEHPWCDLPMGRLGVRALRNRLQDLLGQITDKAFPMLRMETRQMLAESQEALEQLGEPRQTEREQQKYLMAIAAKFQELVRAALNAQYSAHRAFENDKLRLITAVISTTEKFDTDFRLYSEARKFVVDDIDEPRDSESDSNSSDDPAGPVSDSSPGLAVPDLETFNPENFPELNKAVMTGWKNKAPEKGIMDWIDKVYRTSRGIELGVFSPDLLASAFREQSKKWGPMTEQYLSKVILIVHKFILGALEHACRDKRAREELKFAIMDNLVTKYTDGMKQGEFLVDIERNRKPYTLNHYFNSNLQAARGSRVTKSLKRKAQWMTIAPLSGQKTSPLEKNRTTTWILDSAPESSPEKNKRMKSKKSAAREKSAWYVKLDSIQHDVTDKSNTEHVKEEEVHDILEAYYKVARKRFVDNVYNQVVDHCLLSGPASLLLLFSEKWVLDLNAKQLAAIAGEPRVTVDRRERLRVKIQDLEEAIEILR